MRALGPLGRRGPPVTPQLAAAEAQRAFKSVLGKLVPAAAAAGP